MRTPEIALGAGHTEDTWMGEFELLVGLTARLASTAPLDDLVDEIARALVVLGFGAVWIAVLDEASGRLTTIRDLIEGAPSPRPYAREIALDLRQPLGRSFHERRLINVTDPATLYLVDGETQAVPDDRMALPRAVYAYLRGRPFACGPVLGSRRQPVGAVVLSSYHGAEPIPEDVLGRGLGRALLDQLGIAMERALHVARLARLDADLARAQDALARDAKLAGLGQLALGVAHDLNHYAAIAMLAVEVGARSPGDAAEVLPRIAQATRGFRDLVLRLQRAARPPAREAQVADVARIVDDLAAMLRPVLREHAVELDVALEPLPLVEVDPVAIQQVILNLVLNARDALRSSERRTIKLRGKRDGDAVKLVVADTGPGIAPDMLDRLFQPYASSKGTGHLGMGLASSRSSLAQYGAAIEAHNAPGGGAVFTIALPASANDPGPPAPEPEPAPARRARVLAVDDDPDVVYIIRAYLEPRGYALVTATTAAQALDLAATELFDLVLCDVGLPKQSGPEVCRLMRQAGYRGKFVLMTGYDRPAERGAWDAMLKKPFEGRELIHALDGVLEH
jgi:signal transduction histidine kinase